MGAFSKIENPLATLLKAFNGWPVVIPNIEALSPGWTVDENPHLASVREEYNQWVQRCYKDARSRRKIAALNAVGFSALCWPRAGREELLTLSKLIAWYFPWDDYIDDAALSQPAGDRSRYGKETIEVVKESLLSNLDTPSTVHPNPIIQNFWEIGAAIRAKANAESNQRFVDENIRYIKSATEPQGVKETCGPSTVAEYLRWREDNIGFRAVLELINYANKTDIPPQWRWENNIQMEGMWKEITWMSTITNDLLSLGKELAAGDYESLVPLLMYHERLAPQAAVDRGLDMLYESYERFYELEQQLYEMVSSEDLLNVKAYVHACKDLVMSNLHWSYGLKRYMGQGMDRKDGTIRFKVQTPLSE